MRKLSLLTALIIALMTAACTGAMPPPNGAGTDRSPASMSNPSSGDGAATTRQEVQRLFDTLLTAFRSADAALLRSTMTSELALLCTAANMEPWLMENGPRIQAFELESVFIDAENPDRGVAQLALLPARDQAKPLQVESAHWFPITGVPFPLKREEGHWKAGYPVPQEIPDCPYQPHRFVPAEPGAGPGYPNIPGLDFNMWDAPFRNPEPGDPGNIGQTNFTGSPLGTYAISSSTLQATDLSPGELAIRYRERLARPGWNTGSREPESTRRGSLGPYTTARDTCGTEP